eukprot:6200832-Pleurochrysis_carterae.AAC.1
MACMLTVICAKHRICGDCASWDSAHTSDLLELRGLTPPPQTSRVMRRLVLAYMANAFSSEHTLRGRFMSLVAGCPELALRLPHVVVAGSQFSAGAASPRSGCASGAVAATADESDLALASSSRVICSTEHRERAQTLV